MTFRGINKVTNQYVYGDLYQQKEQTFIMEHNGHVTEVFRESVGQTSGAKDERDNNIYVDVFPDVEPDTEYHEGEFILYQNGNRFEIGEIKRIVDDGAFVYYSEGETAAKTPFDCMRKITNAHTIKSTSLGGKIVGEYNLYKGTNPEQEQYTCSACGKMVNRVFESLDDHQLRCLECVWCSR